ATFDNWSENITQQPMDLAYNDFIHRGKNRVVCVKCMLKVKLGTAETQGKDIMIIHAERNLYCGYLYRRVTGKFLPAEKMTEKQIQKRRKWNWKLKNGPESADLSDVKIAKTVLTVRLFLHTTLCLHLIRIVFMVRLFLHTNLYLYLIRIVHFLPS